MEVKIKRLTSWEAVLEDARFTTNLFGEVKEPSDKFKHNILMAQHSPIRDLRFIIEIYDIPCWVSQHISRHDAFAGHYTRESQETHFVGTSRTDRTGLNRDKLPQDAPVVHRISCSAEDLINMSRKRLCKKASFETREVWREVVRKMHELDPIMAKYMTCECLYRGFCPEIESCGAATTPRFYELLEHYRDKNYVCVSED